MTHCSSSCARECGLRSLRDASDCLAYFSKVMTTGMVPKREAVVPVAITGRRRHFIGKWVFRRGRAAIQCQHGHAGHRSIDIEGVYPVPGPVLRRWPPIMPLIGLIFETQSILSGVQCSAFPASCRSLPFSPCLTDCHAHAREDHGACVPRVLCPAKMLCLGTLYFGPNTFLTT